MLIYNYLYILYGLERGQFAYFVVFRKRLHGTYILDSKHDSLCNFLCDLKSLWNSHCFFARSPNHEQNHVITFLDRRNSENSYKGWQWLVSKRLIWQTRCLLSKRNFLGKITKLVSEWHRRCNCSIWLSQSWSLGANFTTSHFWPKIF